MLGFPAEAADAAFTGGDICDKGDVTFDAGRLGQVGVGDDGGVGDGLDQACPGTTSWSEGSIALA